MGSEWLIKIGSLIKIIYQMKFMDFKMARLPRLSIPDIPQHAIQRGNNRQACFIEQEDYEFFLDKLTIYSQKYKIFVHSYVLMTNHIHILLTPSNETGVSQMFQSLGRSYVRYFNNKYQRTGTLWEGRFKSTLVESLTYFLIVSRYIELNPIRAGMVSHPEEYPWSSYQYNANGKANNLITPHSSYIELGRDNIERQINYRELFLEILSEKDLNQIRDSVNKSWALGSSTFQKELELKTGRCVTKRQHGGDRRSKLSIANK
jgi:putative transposase